MNLRKVVIALGYGLPALACLGMAFWAGAQKDPFMGMVGFVPFFMAAAFLVIYGYKKVKNPDESSKDGEAL